jgi:hypothetical protein
VRKEDPGSALLQLVAGPHMGPPWSSLQNSKLLGQGLSREPSRTMRSGHPIWRRRCLFVGSRAPRRAEWPNQR